MRSRGVGLLVCAVAYVAVAPCASAQVSPSDSATFVATTQRLMDGVTHGDTAVWALHLSPRFFMTDEEGRHLTRAEFLKELRGLPAGQEGKLRVANWHLAGGPDVAVFSYDIDEWHDYYGQELRTRFHSTDTWVREGGAWRLLAVQVTALPTPIAGRRVGRPVLDTYAGVYSLTPEVTLRVVASDSGLALVRGARPAERLYAIDDRIFVRHGARGFWLFERDERGAVTRLVHWRDNNPVVWRRAAR